jgi:hypothetical protein
VVFKTSPHRCTFYPVSIPTIHFDLNIIKAFALQPCRTSREQKLPFIGKLPCLSHACRPRAVPQHCARAIPATTTNQSNRLNKSRGQRIVWLLEELGLEYDIAVYKRDENKRAGPELKAVHPLGKSPCVTIRPANSEKDIVIAESETIMEYLCDHFGKHLVPKRYPEGQEGVLGAETEEWMRYKVRYKPSRCDM